MQRYVRKKRLVLKRWIRVLLFMMILSFACFGLYLAYIGMYEQTSEVPFYDYAQTRELKYKVYLKENEFYEEEYIEEGKQLTSELIDYIDTDFAYTFLGSGLTDIKYKYSIDAVISGDYENNTDGRSELWNKKFIIEEETENIAQNTYNLNLRKNVKVNYGMYNEIADQFKSEFRLAIDATLIVTMHVNVEATIQENGKTITDEEVISYEIPLTKSTTTIKVNKEENSHDELTNLIKREKNMFQLYIGILLEILTFIAFLLLFDVIFVNKKTLYKKTLNKIMKDYAEIIVTVETCPSLDELEILYIKDFDDIVDTEEELKSPILQFEKRKDRESWFMVIKDNYVYLYVLSDKTLK